MSSQMAVPQLVPRNKTAKKKKPGFRPVAAAKSRVASKAGKPPKGKSVGTSANPASSASSATQKSSPNTSSPTKAGAKVPAVSKENSKKRKLSTGITIGVSRRANNTDTQNSGEGETAAAATAAAASAEAPATAPAAADGASGEGGVQDGQNSSIVVADANPANQDKTILERLAAEDPEGVRLRSFCSRFRSKRRPRDQSQSDVGQQERRRQRQQQNQQNRRTNEGDSPENQNNTDETGAPVVQIVDGQIVLKESSLMFPGQRRTVQEVEEEFQDVVEEDTQLAIVGASYSSFTDRKHSKKWTVDETKIFFEALRQLGTDFGSMEAFFPNRTRKQLKRKYRMEITKNPKLVEMATDPKYKRKVDLSVFNVEVDPKAIEAAANDEVPEYQPTDVEQTGDAAKDSKQGGTNGDEWEVVEEEGGQEEGTFMGSGSTAKKPQHTPFWSFGGEAEGEEDEPKDDELDFPEPSMDDFFHDQDDDPAMQADFGEEKTNNDEGEDPTKTPAASEQPTVAPAPAQQPQQQPQEEEVSISLVPKKSNAKAKRPKFRSAARKRK